ncbi:MAG: hypothetical protein HY054_09220 [Proteobacteria bacterium]|nr:hypothetical protein [Pseudomonadota bacterium]
MALWLAASLLALLVIAVRRSAWLVLGLAFALPGAATAQIHQPLMIEQWSGWEDLGGALFRGPACTSSQSNRIDCFAVQYGGVIGTRQWAQNTWSAWANVNGVVADSFFSSRPECMSWGPDHVDCFVFRDGDGVPFRRTFHAGFDTGWEALGGALTSAPSCVSTVLRHLDCFGRGGDGQLYRNSFNGDIWSGWSALGGQLLDRTKPSCVVFRGGIVCVTVFTDSRIQVYQVGSNGASITRPQIGNMVQAIAAGTDPSFRCVVAPSLNVQTSRIECFAPMLAPNATLGRWEFDGASWGISDTGAITGGISSYDWDCVAQQDERVDCVDLIGHGSANLPGQTTSITLRHLKLDFLPSANWETVPLTTPAGAGVPIFLRCTSWGPQRLDCFATGGGFSATHMLHAWLSLQPARLRPFTPH